MADRLEVHADLMRAPALELARKQGRAVQPLHDFVGRARRLAAVGDRHAGAAPRVAPDRRIDDAFRRAHAAPCQGGVGAAHRTRLQLPHEARLRNEGFGDHQQAAGVLVQAMHDAGPRDVGKRWRVRKQCIEQGAVRIAGARMDDQSGRLVDDEDFGILVDDLQGHSLRRGRGVTGHCGQRQHHRFPAGHGALAFGRDAFDQQNALFQPGLQTAARILREHPGQRLVQAQSGASRRDFRTHFSPARGGLRADCLHR